MLSRLVSSVHPQIGLRAASSAANNIVSQAQLQSDPSKVAIQYPSERFFHNFIIFQLLFIDGDRKTTYGEFVKRTGQYATALTEKYNIKVILSLKLYKFNFSNSNFLRKETV